MTRVNARLEPDLAERLELVRAQTGQSTSDLLKASLRAYLASFEAKARPADLLADFVGSADDAEDLSSTYKAALSSSLARKHRP